MVDSVSQQAFREALARFVSGVTVVAARGEGELPVGMTATAFSSVSLAPPLVLLCIQKKSTVHDPLTTAPVFGVSVLDESQRTIAEQCARPGLDRFKDVPMRAGAALGAPLVDGALVTLECRRFAAHDAGDHTILVGEVDGSTSRDGAPLLYGNRSFGRFTKDA